MTSENAAVADVTDEDLRAENERLRRALRTILGCPSPDSVERCHDIMWGIAKGALGV